ncbi:MAG: hypothetical protein WBZ11_16700 [Candidatus Sulfotelmatobacter sp.]|jgi:hypothetical protein
MHEDCAILDWWVGRRGVDLCVNQREVRGKTGRVRDNGEKKQKSEHDMDSHTNTYGSGREIVPESFC